MPTYVYACGRCGEFEAEQPISQAALERCPTCGEEVRRMIPGGTGFVMRGKGAAEGRCERSTPCCGRATRCDRPPCGG